MVRVLLFGTHPNSSNGYSKVLFQLAKHLSDKQDLQVTYYGFQNFQKNPVHDQERQLPENVQVYDAFANEKKKEMGFGFEEVTDFVTMNKPDLCVIYNDMVVVSNIIDRLKKVENRKFKIVVYVDQVYLCQKKEYIKRLNDEADFVICFSKYWEECIKGQGLVKPTGVLEHGFNPKMHYPVPRKLARLYFNLHADDFIVMNANRNQPRKRLDIMMMAFAEFVSRHVGEPVKLLIATAPMGAWNLIEIYERELKLRGISMEEGMKHLIFIDNPQALTDEDMNTLYNASDVGLNTAMGEGWGLCNFEAGAMGIPQIVPFVGGFRDFFDKDCAIPVEPKVKVYTDMTIDGCPGCAEICDAVDFANAMDVYYADEVLRKKHGETARTRILSNYRWFDLGEKLYSYIKQVAGKEAKAIIDAGNDNEISLEDIAKIAEGLDKNLNVNLDIGSIPTEPTQSTEPIEPADPAPVPQVQTAPVVPAPPPPAKKSRASPAERKEAVKSRLKEKVTQRRKKDDIDKDELQKLKNKIDLLLQK
jgi:glycosyltransferase involved in cell wall biosynthesis